MTRLALLLVVVAAVAALPLQDAPSSQADLLNKLLMVNPQENDINDEPLPSLSPKTDKYPSPQPDISPSPIPDASTETQKLDPTPVDAEATPTEDQVEGTEEKAETEDVQTQLEEEAIPELPAQDREQILSQADLEERRVVMIDPAFVEPEIDQEQPNDYEVFVMQDNSEVMRPDPGLKYFIDEEEEQLPYESEEVIPDYIEPLQPGIYQLRELSESEEVPEYSIVNLPFEPNFEEEEEEDDFSVEPEMEPSPDYYEEPEVDPGFLVVEQEDPMNSFEMDDQNYEESDEEEYEVPLELQEEPAGSFSWVIPGFMNEEVNSEESELNEEPPFVEDPVDYEMTPENEGISPNMAALDDPDYDVVIDEDGPNSDEFLRPDYEEEPIELPMNEEDVSFETYGENEDYSDYEYGVHHDNEEIPEYDGYYNPEEKNNIPKDDMPEEPFGFIDRPTVEEFHPIMFPDSFFDSEDDMSPVDEPLMYDNEFGDDDDEPVSEETPGYSIAIYSKPRPISDFDGPEPDPVPLGDILFPFMNADRADNDDDGMMMENNDASQEQFDDSQMSLLPIVGETMMPEQQPLPIAEYPDVHYPDMNHELHWTPDHDTHEDRPAFFPMNNEPNNVPVFFNRWSDNVPYSSFQGPQSWDHHRQSHFRMGGYNPNPVTPLRFRNSPAPHRINDFGPRYPDSYDFHYSNGPMAPPRAFYEPFNSRQNYNPYNDYSQQSYIIPLGPNGPRSDYNVFQSPNGAQYRPEQDIYRSGPQKPSVSSYYEGLDNMNNIHPSPFNTFHKPQQQADTEVQPIEMTIYADPESSFSSRSEQFPFFLLKHIDRILSARNSRPASARSPQGYTGSTIYPNVPSPHDRYAPEYF